MSFSSVANTNWFRALTELQMLFQNEDIKVSVWWLKCCVKGLDTLTEQDRKF